MTTLRIALAQSPIRAAYATARHDGTVEVRALDDQRGANAGAAPEQYEIRLRGQAMVVGGYDELLEIVTHLRGPNGAQALEWQPCWFPGQ